jgi:hypothetical protein
VSDNEERKPARYVVKSVQVMDQPDVQTLVRDALSIVADEVMRFKKKSNSGKNLDLSESRVLQGYIKCLVELSKESRERADSQDLANLSNDELLKLVDQLRGQAK